MSQQSARQGRLAERGRARMGLARRAYLRKVLATPTPREWRLIASKDDGVWRLYHRPDADSNGWHSLVLRHHDKTLRKVSYWCGWNGSRLGRNSDLATLDNNHPKIYAWLEATCRRKWS